MNYLLTVRDLSSYAQVHPATILKLVKNGEIPYIRSRGLGIRFKKDAIDQWLEQHSTKTSPILDHLSNVDLSLEAYDRLFLGGEKMSPKGKTWNYPFGSVYLRQSRSGKDRWYIYYRVEGKRVRKAVKQAQSRADALKLLTSKVADAFRGKYGFKKAEKSEDVLFEAFGKEFLELYSRVHWRAKTIEGHENSLRHLNRFFKGKRLSEITPELTAHFVAQRKAKVKASTLNRELSCLKCVLNKAVEWGKLEANPIAKVKKFRESDPKNRILYGEESRRLWKACADHLGPIVLTALCTGMRRGEILGLTWGQVDLGKRTIRIERTKSGRERTVFINGLLLHELQRLGMASRRSEYVFLGPNGKPMMDVKTAFKTACRRAGIKGLRFHDLRHHAASKMVEAGIDLVTVSKILGHASIQTTMRYAHPTPENMRKAVELLGQDVASPEDFVPKLSPKNESPSVNAFITAN